MMDSQDWRNMGSVFRAGSRRAAGWVYNSDRQQDAEILQAQAERCEEIARELDGNPAAEHDHDHFHEGENGKIGHRYRHAHAHHHGDGENEHDDPAKGGHRHEPMGRLSPARWGNEREELR